MVNSVRKNVAIGCQGGGMHAAFEVGVLTAVLERIEPTALLPKFLRRVSASFPIMVKRRMTVDEVGAST
jgi:predicted acylesterase/phospholipase RssA